MIIGVPREIKNNENRVALTPSGAEVLNQNGHKVLVETNAGIGSGFTNQEYIEAGAEIFQIWFDPEINQALQKPASYDDYAASTFPVTNEDGAETRVLKGEKSPIKMDSEGITIKEKTFKEGTHSIVLNKSSIYSVFLLEGNLNLNGQEINTRDFFKVSEETKLDFNTKGCKLFIIESLLLLV